MLPMCFLPTCIVSCGAFQCTFIFYININRCDRMYLCVQMRYEMYYKFSRCNSMVKTVYVYVLIARNDG